MRLSFTCRLIGIYALAIGLAGCSRQKDEVEVIIQQTAASPTGAYEARVETHVYGPHLGGATPADEVHVAPTSAKDASEVVFRVAGERGPVSIRWTSPTRLQISYSHSESPSVYRPTNAPIQVELNLQ